MPTHQTLNSGVPSITRALAFILLLLLSPRPGSAQVAPETDLLDHQLSLAEQELGDDADLDKLCIIKSANIGCPLEDYKERKKIAVACSMDKLWGGVAYATGMGARVSALPHLQPDRRDSPADISHRTLSGAISKERASPMLVWRLALADDVPADAFLDVGSASGAIRLIPIKR